MPGTSSQGRGTRDSINAASLPALAATPEDLEAIRLACLEKEIDLELILEKWQIIPFSCGAPMCAP